MIRTYGMTSHEVADEVAKLDSKIKTYKEAIDQLIAIKECCISCEESINRIKELLNDPHNRTNR